jgi:hypothetical protein
MGERSKAMAASVMAIFAIASGCESPSDVSPAPPNTPASLADLLLNIRQVTASGAILRDDFYDSENLKMVFGAGTVDYIQRCAVNIVPKLRDFPAWLPRQGPEGKTYDAIDVRVRKYQNIEGIFGASIILNFTSGSRPRPDFDEIQRLFGRNWTECPPDPPSPHGPIYVPPTRPHGNACIIYALGRGSPSQIRFRFMPDATLDYALANAGASEMPLWRTQICPQ